MGSLSMGGRMVEWDTDVRLAMLSALHTHTKSTKPEKKKKKKHEGKKATRLRLANKLHKMVSATRTITLQTYGTTERCVAAPRSSRPAVAAVAEVAEAGSTILQRRLWFLVVFVDKLASAR